MILTEKQTKFATFIVENIMEGIIPVIKSYIDNKVQKTKEEIISEVKTNGSLNVEKLDETKKTLKEHSFSLAKDLFGDDADFGTAYDELKNLSPKNPAMKESSTNTTIRDTNIDNLEINYSNEVSMDSVLKQADKVNESIATGDYVNPSINVLKNLENKDFSKFLE